MKIKRSSASGTDFAVFWSILFSADSSSVLLRELEFLQEA